MRYKLVGILMILLATSVVQLQADAQNAPSEKVKALQLCFDDPSIFQHILESVSEDGGVITFKGKMSLTIKEAHRSEVCQWKEGEQIYLFFDSNLCIQLKHAHVQTTAWGVLRDHPSSMYLINNVEVSPCFSVKLSNGFVCKSRHQNGSGWKIKDKIIVLNNSDGIHQVWNTDKQEIVLCESVENCNKPLVIKNILNLEDKLNAKVLQQPEATKAVVESLLNYTAGLNEQEKPIGVFLFIGPTGVGKTELAKTLAFEIYDHAANILRFDMSHFTEPYSISRLLGSPPGYMNHEEGGQLTQPLLHSSKIIVLLDEVEKAHPQVIKIFLPVFDEGFVLDTKHNRVACSDTIFIMTSNLCATRILELFNKGYSSEEVLAEIEPQLIEALTPEIYNRVEPVLFRPIAKESMNGLVDLMLDKIAKRLELIKHIHIHIDPSLRQFLVENGYHPLLGARPLKKLIEKKVLSVLARMIVKEGVERDSKILLKFDDQTRRVHVQKL